MFFWFFESRSNPKDDPLILWMSGGPGCASTGAGLFFELGPATITPDMEVKTNPWSWNKNANVIFLDQPVGAGYSFSQNTRINSTPAAMDMVVSFLKLLYQQFPQYSKLPFHIATESYGGHYGPVLADAMISTGMNLTSLMIGNGITDPYTQYAYYYPFACEVNHVLSDSTCQSMQRSVAGCQQAIQQCYNNPNNRFTCSSASFTCESSQLNPYSRAGLNPYDYRLKCPNGGLCYSGLDDIQQYLNMAHVKETLGVKDNLNYQSCSNDINMNFNLNGDWVQPYQKHITSILQHKVPILIYAGDKDFICNWLGNQAWTKAIEWQGKAAFQKKKPGEWQVSGKKAGEVTNYDIFTFLRIFDAGHMVPHDKPREAWEMMNNWVNGKRQLM
ncbi:vacuolar serine-type carboxypeptidase Atg42p [Trichomonascus vanleenenianus]|uniref:S10 family peptidase n=1 Tax=Trichomonascus vanleenenianus TaxID=2268995 RepID=UPI003EC9B2AA